MGISLGLGMPNCMGYFTDNVSVEKRGRIGGITMLVSGFGMLALGATLANNIIVVSTILFLWRASGLAIFLLTKPSEKNQQSNLSKPSYRVIFTQQSFLLYFVPWVMFSLVNYLSTYVELGVLGAEAFTSLTTIENAIIGVSASIGGFFLDTIGRKRVAITGFVLLGIGYAVLGLYPFNPFSWYFNIVADGIAWGFLLGIFVVTIWGDLSHTAPSDKYYAIGVLPFFISKLLELLIGTDIAGMITENALFSFIAFFLFLAVLPLIYAPETLPEKTLKARELKSYTEKALKKAQKEAEKSQKNHSDEAEKSKEEPEESPEDAEARKLAEKYY